MLSKVKIKIYLKAGVSTEKVAQVAKEIKKMGIFVSTTLDTIGVVTCQATKEQIETLKHLISVEKVEEDE